VSEIFARFIHVEAWTLHFQVFSYLGPFVMHFHFVQHKMLTSTREQQNIYTRNTHTHTSSQSQFPLHILPTTNFHSHWAWVCVCVCVFLRLSFWHLFTYLCQTVSRTVAGF